MSKSAKKCTTCKKFLSKNMFCKCKSNKDGLNYHCKVCAKKRAIKYRNYNKASIKQYSKEYREKNREKLKITKREYYKTNKVEINKKSTNYVKNHPEQYRKYCRKSRKNLKIKVFQHYCLGDIKCKCGEKDIDVLTIDHINNNGYKHKKLFNLRGGSDLYRWLKKNNYPNEFQVLCMNCQILKRASLAKFPTKIWEKNKNLKRQKNKEIVFEHYGKNCVHCGNDNLDILTIDHVNNDGAEHRKKIKARGSLFYKYLIINDFPNNPPLQTLCFNCQTKKEILYRISIHH